MNDVCAFADEYGNNSFEFDKQGTHFIVASIICKKENQKNIEIEVEKIRKKYFQTGEMKSSKVADNTSRRIKILNDILKLDFSIYAILVDKKRLYGEGFKYKQSFYKYLNGLVFKELFKTFQDLTLTVDEHGSNKFMLSFKKYVQKNHIRDLFSTSSINFTNSPENILIQLADFIAGTLGHIFDETKKNESSRELLNMLKEKIISLNFFPTENISYSIEDSENIDNFDKNIADISIRRALDFIDRKKSKNQEEVDQVNCLKYLLMVFCIFNYNNYISTKELMWQLQVNRNDEINEHYFRTSIIAKIRDEGVLLTSCSYGFKTGYKLPSSKRDLHNFVSHGNNMIIPMLQRIKRTRDIVKLGKNNEVDILDKEEYKKLKSIIENYI